MPREIGLARWESPVRTTAAGVDLIKAAGEFGKGFREAQFVSDVEGYAEETMYMADQQRRTANEYGIDANPGARLQRATSARADEMLSQGEQGLVAAEQQVGERAFRNFKRYKDAVDQGASNPAAARISIEKEMRDLIRSNPGFANVISQAANQAMTATEFQVLTRDPDAVKNVNENLTPFEKTLLDLNKQADFWGDIYSWNPEQRESFITTEADKYIRAEALGRSLSAANNKSELTNLDVEQYGQGYVLQVQTEVEDIINSYGLLEGEMIPQERVELLKVQFKDAEQAAITDFHQRVAGKGASSDTISRTEAKIREQYKFVNEMLDSQSAATILETKAKLHENGAYISFTEFAPVIASLSEGVGGDNAAYFANVLLNPESPEAQYAFASSPWFAEINERASDLGLSESAKIKMMAKEFSDSVNRYMGRPVLNGASVYDGAAVDTLLRSTVDLPVEKKSSVEAATNLSNLASLADPKYTKYLLESKELTPENINTIDRIYKPALESTFEAMRNRVNALGGDNSYAVLTMDDAGKVQMNVIVKSGDDNFYVYPVADGGMGVNHSQMATEALSVYKIRGGNSSLVSNNKTKGKFSSEVTDPRAWVNDTMLQVNDGRATPDWFSSDAKDARIKDIVRKAKNFQNVYSTL